MTIFRKATRHPSDGRLLSPAPPGCKKAEIHDLRPFVDFLDFLDLLDHLMAEGYQIVP